MDWPDPGAVIDVAEAMAGAMERQAKADPSANTAPDVLSAVYAMYVTWVCAVLEANVGSYKRHVIPEVERRGSGYDAETAQGLWGIRVAFTHSDGRLDKITMDENRAWAQRAARTFDSVEYDEAEARLVLTHDGIVMQARTFLLKVIGWAEAQGPSGPS